VSAETAAGLDRLMQDVQQHLSGPLDGASANNVALLAGQPPQSAQSPQPVPSSGGSG
jgi:hypothetical protein